MDLRENLITQINSTLSVTVPQEYLQTIQNTIAIALSNYEISERCTDLVVQDTTTEKILKLYAGSLLTEGKSKKTVKGYVSFLKRFSYEIDKPLLDLNVFDIRVYLAKKQSTVSKNTCATYRSYLAAFYQWLSVEEIISANPMVRIKPFKTNDEVKEPFSDVDIDKLRSACTNKRSRALLELMLSSGARVSEVANLDISDVNYQDLSILIRHGKGGKQRIAYINPICAVHLKEYLSERNYTAEALFTSNYQQRISVGSIERGMHRLEEKSGVNNVHPHRFRRTFATNLAKRGVDLRTIQMLMGHSNINTTMRYITLSSDYVRNSYKFNN